VQAKEAAVRRFLVISMLATFALGVFVASAHAYPSTARATKMSCATCHSVASGGAGLTDAGKAFMADNKKVPAASVAGADYIGTAKCKMCHAKVHTAWAATGHAKALENMAKADPKTNEEMAKKAGVTIKGTADKTDECLSCHVTGMGMTGGFVASDATKAAAMAGVGCEACHGPGSKHLAAPKDQKKTTMDAIGEKMCMDCHTKTFSPSFSYAEAKAKGVHAVAE
jgi:hypothetical protein